MNISQDKYGPPRQFKLDISQFQSPAKVASYLYQQGCYFYIYEMWYKVSGILEKLKTGQGRYGTTRINDDRIARQLEGLHGWHHNYNATSAVEFKSKCQQYIGYVPHKNDIHVSVFDFSAQCQKIDLELPWESREKRGHLSLASKFIDYKEAERINWDVQNNCVPPLNVDVPKFVEGSWDKDAKHAQTRNNLFEHY